MSTGLLSAEQLLESLDVSLDLPALQGMLSNQVRDRALQLLNDHNRIVITALDAQTPQQLEDVLSRINGLPRIEAILKLRTIVDLLPQAAPDPASAGYGLNERPFRG